MQNTSFTKYLFLFILIILIQITILNNIIFTFLWYALPVIYIYFIIKLPLSLNKNILLLLAFVLGFIIDVSNDSLGVNTSIIVLIAFVKRPIGKLYLRNRNEEIKKDIPGIATWGFTSFLSYTFILLFLQLFLIFLIENLENYNWFFLLPHFVSSILVSLFFIMIFDKLFMPKLPTYE